MALLIIISLMYRYTERYNYGKDRAEEEDQEVILERDPQVARLVKERNITGEDLDRVKAFIKDPLRYS
jgi:hypothetical protein